jgi:hypothetical protein
MHALAWVGLFILALGLLAWFVFRVTLWFAGLLFLLGMVLLIRGFSNVKRTV